MMTILPAHITGPIRFPLSEMAVLTVRRFSVHRSPLFLSCPVSLFRLYRRKLSVRTVSGLAQLASPETVRTIYSPSNTMEI